MEEYHYSRLPQPAQGRIYVRRLLVLPGNSGDDLLIHLHDVDLNLADETDDREWFALSYTWGDVTQTSKIYVVPTDVRLTGGQIYKPIEDERRQRRYLKVTQTLFVFLQHIRHREITREAWIDAICIDQGGAPAALQERGEQVKMMGHIYARATHVLIWLGPDYDNGSHALSLLHELGNTFTLNWITMEISTVEGVPSASMQKWLKGQVSPEDVQAISRLLWRPWFTRVWIRQEAYFAHRKNSVVVCGGLIASYSAFSRALHFLSFVGLATDSDNQRLLLALACCQQGKPDRYSLLRSLRMADCKDQRDRFYGLLGILTSADKSFEEVISNLAVDYSDLNTVGRVYQRLLEAFIEGFGNLRLLEEAGLWQESSLRPTWVPDWRVFKAGEQLDLSMNFASSHFLNAECDLSKPDVLGVLGRCVGEVSSVDLFDVLETTVTEHDQQLNALNLIANRMAKVDPAIIAERVSYLFYGLLLGLRVPLHEIEALRRSIEPYFEHIIRGEMKEQHTATTDLQAPNERLPAEAVGYFGRVLQHLRKGANALLFTDYGHVGVGSPVTRSGDEIWAILGSKALMILRRLHSGQYLIVGPSFMHGFNWGEAFLGSLPDGFAVQPMLDTLQDSYTTSFSNDRTKEVTMWDPRIKWKELEAHPPMANFEYIPAPPNEPLRVRPGSEYLRRHGISYQRIELV